MQRGESLLRWGGAVGVVLAPLGISVLPALFFPSDFENAEEQFRAMAGGSEAYAPLLLQTGGAIFLLVAALGIGGYTILRGRGGTLGAIGLIVGMVGAICALVTMGFELSMAFVLQTAPDRDTAVTMALALNSWPPFVICLIAAIAGFLLALPMLALALWRARVVPLLVPLLFLLPPLIGLIPVPVLAGTVATLLTLVPCVWMAVQLIRVEPEGVTPATGAAASADHRHAVEV